jgi:hypothetical protein
MTSGLDELSSQYGNVAGGGAGGASGGASGAGGTGGSANGGASAGSAGMPGVETLVVGQDVPTWLVLDADNVYWLTNVSAYTGSFDGPLTSTVNKAPKIGGTPTWSLPEINVAGIAVDDSYVYWAAGVSSLTTMDGAVRRVSKAGGSPTTLSANENDPTAVTLDDTYVYWGTSAGELARMPKAGGMRESLATGLVGINQIVIAGNDIYATTSVSMGDTDIGGVSKVSKNGGMPTALAVDETEPYGIGSNGVAVYWTTMNEVLRYELAGGTESTIASGQSDLDGVAADANTVYWAGGGDGTIYSAPASGGALPTVVALEQSTPWGIALDDSYVYWTTADPMIGTVRRAARHLAPAESRYALARRLVADRSEPE